MTAYSVTDALVSKTPNMFNIHDLTNVIGTGVVGRVSVCGRMIFIHFFIKENFYMNAILFFF